MGEKDAKILSVLPRFTCLRPNVWNKNSNGVSLLEAFLASIIFVIAAAAIFTTLQSLRKPATENEQAVQAALVLSNFLDDLRSKIDTRDVVAGDYTGNLKLGPHPKVIISDPTGVLTQGYSMKWTVYCADASTPCAAARKVNAEINWSI